MKGWFNQKPVSLLNSISKINPQNGVLNYGACVTLVLDILTTSSYIEARKENQCLLMD